ncbi:MarR family transcriptional regulator [Nitrospinae bacterium AH_259_B05_G02_I21]|nr:MarR family transcriptional regulator [Nitrospinae bacterium AH_259_B05_G02_I21]MDA2932507.1 MarR family transcriptional regulator [Nitrospinae bacterium AH-259-F20]
MDSTALQKPSPAEALMRELKRHGTMTIKELEGALGVTRTAVRQQLEALQAKGLVERTVERHGVGRPKGLYSLTAEGGKLFAREYEALLWGVLDELQAAEGETKVRDLLGRVSQKMADAYGPLPVGQSLADRLASLAERLTRRGHVTDVHPTPEGYTLRMYSCPYQELVTTHPAICEMERSMFDALLQSRVELDRCILDGQETYCTYTVAAPERGSGPEG